MLRKQVVAVLGSLRHRGTPWVWPRSCLSHVRRQLFACAGVLLLHWWATSTQAPCASVQADRLKPCVGGGRFAPRGGERGVLWSRSTIRRRADASVGSVLAQIEELDRQEEEEDDWDEEIDDYVGFEDNADDAAYTEGLVEQLQNIKTNHQRAMELCREAGHSTVFLLASIDFLFPSFVQNGEGKYDGNYVDCTFGRGGHSRQILSQISSEGRHHAFDIDPSAAVAGEALMREDDRFTFFARPFTHLVHELPKDMPLHGVLLDIGISSPQVDQKDRGFSLQNLMGPERPLDLRMNPRAGDSVSDILTQISVEQLAWIIREFGDVHEDDIMVERIAHAIMDDQAQRGPYTSMRRFAEVIGRTKLFVRDDDVFTHPTRGIDHPARLVVQALRIFANREAEQLDTVLPLVFEKLVPGGRCLISAFKPVDERILQKFLLTYEDPDPDVVARLSKRRLRELYPLVGTDLNYSARLVGKPLRPPLVEIGTNPRARSGVLYIIEKAPRHSKFVKVKPRLPKNRFKEAPYPALHVEEED